MIEYLVIEILPGNPVFNYYFSLVTVFSTVGLVLGLITRALTRT